MSSAPGSPDRSMDWFANLKAPQIATLTQTWDALQKIPSESEIQFLGTVTRLEQDQVLWWFHARANHAPVTKAFRQRRREGAGDRDTLILPALKEYALFQQYGKGDPIQQREIIKTPDPPPPPPPAGDPRPRPKRRPGPRSKSMRTTSARIATVPTSPTEPTEPTEPTKSTEPTEPTEPTKSTEPTEPTEPTQPTGSTEPTAIKRRREATALPSGDDEPPTFRTRSRRAKTIDPSSTDIPASKRIRSSTNALTYSTPISVASLLIRVEETEPVLEEDLVMESGKITPTTATSPKILRSSASGSSPNPATRKSPKEAADSSPKGEDISEIEHQDKGGDNSEGQTVKTNTGPRRGTRIRRPSHPAITTSDSIVDSNNIGLKPTPAVEEDNSSTIANATLTSKKSTGPRRRGRSVARVAVANTAPTDLPGAYQRGISAAGSPETHHSPIEPAVTRQRGRSAARAVDANPVATEHAVTRRGRSRAINMDANPAPTDTAAIEQRSRSAAKAIEANSTQSSSSSERGRSKARADKNTTSSTTSRPLRQRGRSAVAVTGKMTSTQSTGSTQLDQGIARAADAVTPSSESSNSRQRSQSMTRTSWVDELNMFATIVPKFRTKTPVASPQEVRADDVDPGLPASAAQFSVSGRDPRIAPGQPTPYSSPDVASVATTLQDTPVTDMDIASASAPRIAIPLFPVLYPGLSSDPRISHVVNMEPFPQLQDEHEAERRESRKRDAVRRVQERERLQREDEEREEMERILGQNTPMKSAWSPSPKSPSPTLPNGGSRSPPSFEPTPSLATPSSFSGNVKYAAIDLSEPASKVNGSWIDPSRRADDAWDETTMMQQRSNKIHDRRSSKSSDRQVRDDHNPSHSHSRRSRDDHRTRDDDSHTRSYGEPQHRRRESPPRSRSPSRSDHQSRYEHSDDHSHNHSDRPSRHGHRDSLTDHPSRPERRDGDRQSLHGHHDGRSHNRSDRKSRHERRDGSRSRTSHKSRKDRPSGRSRSRSQKSSRNHPSHRSRHRNRHASHSQSRSKERRSSRRQASPRPSPPRETSADYREHRSYSRYLGEQNMDDISASVPRHPQGVWDCAQPDFDMASIGTHVSESLNETSTNSRSHSGGSSGNSVDISMQSDASQVPMTAQEKRPIQKIMTQMESENRGADSIVEPEKKVTLDTVEKSANLDGLSVEESGRQMAEETPTNSVVIPVAFATAGIESDTAPPSEARGPLFRQSRSHASRNYRRSRPSTPTLVVVDIQRADNGPSKVLTNTPIPILPAVAPDQPAKTTKIQRMSMPDLETLVNSIKQSSKGIESTADDGNDTTMESALPSRRNSSTLTVTEESVPVAENDKIVPVTVLETAAERPRRMKKGKRAARDY